MSKLLVRTILYMALAIVLKLLASANAIPPAQPFGLIILLNLFITTHQNHFHKTSNKSVYYLQGPRSTTISMAARDTTVRYKVMPKGTLYLRWPNIKTGYMYNTT